MQVNILKTKIIVFNKSGKFIKDNFLFEGVPLECVKSYKYLGVLFCSSGLFHESKANLFQRAMKASFKLEKKLSSCNPSVNTMLHLFDHTIKPIALYGCEIWGMFNTKSSACKRSNEYIFNNIFLDDHADRLHLKFLKHILGVHRKTTNIGVLSEMGRYPIYISIVISMIKYLHRLEKLDEGLLSDAFVCNKDLHSKNIPTWYSAALFCTDKLNINISQVHKGKVGKIVQSRLCAIFLDFWKEKQTQYKVSEEGKLDTFFKLKDCLRREKYLDLKEFSDRQIISKIRKCTPT